MVRLEVASSRAIWRDWSCFNSTMVRLEDARCPWCDGEGAGFNSTMVRLEALCEYAHSRATYPFQFHNGSIRRLPEEGEAAPSPRFNSTMVRLEALSALPLPGSCRCFNSTMVRLEGGEGAASPSSGRFQFHNGSIRSSVAWHSHGLEDQFQFHNGSIRSRSSYRAKATALGIVSIPQWFD